MPETSLETNEIENADNSVSGQSDLTGADQAKTEKRFSQSELDNAIKARLEREKVTNKKALDDLTQNKASLEEQVKSASEMLDKYREVITNRVIKQLEVLPEPVKELVSKLDPIEQLEWLEKNANTYSAKQGVPSVPEPSNGRVQIGDLISKKRASGIY